MTYIKQLGLFLMFTAISVTTSAGAKPRIATVDMQTLFAQYFRTTQAQEQFNKDYAGIQKRANEQIEEINELALQLRTLGEKLNSGDLNEEQMLKYRQEFQLIDQQRGVLITEKARNEEEGKRVVADRKAASMQGIMSEIRARVAKIAQEQGYDYVFDQSGKNTNQVSFFIYLKDAVDITAIVLEELNQFAPGSSDD